jgi:hypothetical protein
MLVIVSRRDLPRGWPSGMGERFLGQLGAERSREWTDATAV